MRYVGWRLEDVFSSQQGRLNVARSCQSLIGGSCTQSPIRDAETVNKRFTAREGAFKMSSADPRATNILSVTEKTLKTRL